METFVVWGQTPAPEAAVMGLTVLDWIVVACYALGTLLLGWYFGRNQKSTKEYFVGSGSMNSILIGVSLFATLLSTISYLSMPGEAIGKGPVWLVTLLGYPIIYLVAGYVLLPIYMRHRVTSAYELLEQKLGRGTRRLGAALFIVLRLAWMSTLIYFAAEALALIIGVNDEWEPLIVLITGMIAVGYTSLGGLRAVVITDFAQTVLLYGGALLVIVVVSFHMGGLQWFPAEWHANWDEQPLFSFDPSVRVTVVGALLTMTIWHVCTLGGDQTSVQRFMATADLKAARRSLAANLTVGAVVLTTLFLAGFALLGYYQAFPEALGQGLSLEKNADKIFPHFIATGFPPAVSGLVVSALLAAAMSSVDSGVNSITAVVMSDFLPPADEEAGEAVRSGLKPSHDLGARQQRRFRQARLLAFAIGALVVATSWLVKYVPGNITDTTMKTVNLLTVPIFCLFFFALFVKIAKPVGVWLGCVVGIIVAVLTAYSGPIFGYLVVLDSASDPIRDPVSMIWMSPATLAANLLVGWLACRFLPDRETFAGRMWSYTPAVLAVVFVVGLATWWRPAPRIQLTEANRDKCLEVLRAGLASDEFWPSMHAAEGLTVGGQGDEVREKLEPRLEEPLDDQQRCGVARELVRAGDEEKLPILFNILEGEEDFGRVHAAESLFKVHPTGDAPALRAAMKPTQPDAVRRMAAGALARAHDPAALAYLRECMLQPEPETFQIAAWILGRTGGGKKDIALLKSRLPDAPTPLIRAYLQHSLATLGDEEGMAALLQNLDSDDPKVRTYAATFAGDAGDLAAAPKLLKMLDDPDLDARIRAAQSLLRLARR
ncbi:sodium:solute symporter family transporter [Lignipirellula cremea]|uniref:Sodium/glucose cotransporter n=1 Tax=Lignipirellula cremea TaxID=2528010 RepID=A0A518DUS9_9BACT|nr:HEAT repeat domain-containing protein [Lignipirellula cremea]QDU95595.1 Sodium/glucose cotransporter [Lignipirellula cremea]